MNSALLVIDVQNEFFKISPETARSLEGAIEYINAAIAMFREKGLPVVSIQHMNEAEGLVPGVEGFDLPQGLSILPGDLHIVKTYGNAFNKTELLAKLQEMGVDTVVLTGFCAEACVLSTYRGALDVDLVPILFRGSLASTKPHNIPLVESISDLISYGALKRVLA